MGKHILLVTSPKLIAQLVTINLSRGGLHVTAAKSGADGLRQAEEEQADVVLVDPWLPDMDGTEFLRRLRSSQATRHIQMVLLTDAAHVAALFAEQGLSSDRAWRMGVRLNRLLGRRNR